MGPRYTVTGPGNRCHCPESMTQGPQPREKLVMVSLPGRVAVSDLRLGYSQIREAWSRHHRKVRAVKYVKAQRCEESIFQGSGIESQGTKWFGTWELQVKLSMLSTERLSRTATGCSLAQTRSKGPPSLGPQEANTLQLRTIHSMARKTVNIDSESTFQNLSLPGLPAFTADASAAFLYWWEPPLPEPAAPTPGLVQRWSSTAGDQV